VIKAIRNGASYVEVAERFEITRQTDSVYWKRYQETGEVYLKQQGGHMQSRIEPYRQQIAGWLQEKNDLTLATLQQRLEQDCGVQISISTLGYHLDRMNLSYKKTLRASEQNRSDIAAKRDWWRWMQLLWDPHRLVFLDETGLNTKMTRLYGRSPKGSRCFGSVPHGHWNSSTFLYGSHRGSTTCQWSHGRGHVPELRRTTTRSNLMPW